MASHVVFNDSNGSNNGTEPESDLNKGIPYDKLFLMIGCTVVGLFTVLSSIPILSVSAKAKKFRLMAFLALGELIHGVAFLTAGPARIIYLYMGVYSKRVNPLYCLLNPLFYGFHVGWVWPPAGTSAIVTERAVALLAPIWYRKNWTRKRENQLLAISVLTIAVWVLPAPVITITKYLNGDTTPLQCSASKATSNNFRLAQNIYSIVVGVMATIVTLFSFFVGMHMMRSLGGCGADSNANQRNVEREKRIARTITAVVLSMFLFVILPNFLQTLRTYGLMDISRDVKRMFVIQACLNSAIHLYIYLLLHSQFRHYFKYFVLHAEGNPAELSFLPKNQDGQQESRT